uniref:SCAN box domain-containing protein n=1 Tax=Erpetoichthys calabaricus TaxID=27687 RepID=A0A8C4RXN6_ERPCA
YFCLSTDEDCGYSMAPKKQPGVETPDRAILEKFEIRTETYRIRFRSVEWEHGQPPKELLALLKELSTKWLQPDKHTVDQIIDFVLLEQHLQVFLVAHRPRNLRREDKVSIT